MKLYINKIQHHRNGVSGAPFDVVLFREHPNGRMLGIVFEQDCHVAVFNLKKLAQGNITFGDNSWRGDDYEAGLRSAIACHDLNDHSFQPPKGE